MGPLPPVAGMAPPIPLRPEDNLDIRDALSAFVGKGYIGTSDDNARAIYSMLRSRLGADVAQKMLTHLSLYNQRPDVLKLAPEDRVKQFYDIGSRDADVQSILARSGVLDKGPVPGMRESGQQLASEMYNRKWYQNGPVAPASALVGLQRAANRIK